MCSTTVTTLFRQSFYHSNDDKFQEGPHSALCDEEFYDAMETGLDKIDEENQIKDRLKHKSGVVQVTPCVVTPVVKHRLWSEVRYNQAL